ncbi:MAG: hypothetical protein JO030_04575 [Candidatus Eremiobacteraeota bacterium]|nr:hypothetical protein [Candidatus Eremiobacteraeota bacterium]
MTAYTPDREDWIWFFVLPLLSYAAIFGAACAMLVAPPSALFIVAGASALLIFIGIRDAWDVVTFLATRR